MNKTDVVTALNTVREAARKWNAARLKYKADESAVMRRLAMEGAVNYMSPEDIAQHSGLTVKAVRLMLRAEGLDPRRSKAALSKHAARTLADNAALLGMEPRDMDLMSPLAYLPAGSALRQAASTSVTADDLDEPLVHTVYFDLGLACDQNNIDFDKPVLITFKPDQITCPACCKVSVKA